MGREEGVLIEAYCSLSCHRMIKNRVEKSLSEREEKKREHDNRLKREAQELREQKKNTEAIIARCLHQPEDIDAIYREKKAARRRAKRQCKAFAVALNTVAAFTMMHGSPGSDWYISIPESFCIMLRIYCFVDCTHRVAPRTAEEEGGRREETLGRAEEGKASAAEHRETHSSIGLDSRGQCCSIG